jgi:type IV secretory pathway TrbD component
VKGSARPGPLAGGLLAGALLVACCALGPAVVAAGIVGALTGLGTASWLVAGIGLGVAATGAALMLQRRRAARCRPRRRRARRALDE